LSYARSPLGTRPGQGCAGGRGGEAPWGAAGGWGGGLAAKARAAVPLRFTLARR